MQIIKNGNQKQILIANQLHPLLSHITFFLQLPLLRLFHQILTDYKLEHTIAQSLHTLIIIMFIVADCLGGSHDFWYF